MNITILIFFLSTVFGGSYYVKTLISDNEALKISIITEKEANKSYLKAISSMDKEIKLERKIAENSERNRIEVRKKLLIAKKELTKVLTNDEKKCYNAKVPIPVINGIIKRLQSTGKNNKSNSRQIPLPKQSDVLTDDRTPIVIKYDLSRGFGANGIIIAESEYR